MLNDVIPTPLALGFFSPWFFWAGAGLVSLPILIHILNRRRFKTIYWAAMEYLLQAMRKNRRRLKFEQWILLAARCLVMVLIGAALARPLGCRDQAGAGILGQNTGVHIYIVDNSYSMTYEGERAGARTHLDQAKALARGLLERLTSGSESVVVITAARPAAAVIAAPNYDLNSVRGAIERIEQSGGGTDMDGALKLALKIAREAKEPKRNLHILSDATFSSLPTETTSSVEQSSRELAKLFEVHYHNLGNTNQWNHAVLNVEPESPIVTAKEAFARPFVGDIKGFGVSREGTIQWKLNDVDVAGTSKSLRLEATTPPQSEMIRPNMGGSQVITVSVVGEDRLRIDNVRHRIVDVVSDVKVLLVEGARGPTALDSSAAFLESALAPPKEATTQSADGGISHSYMVPELKSDWELGNNIRPEYRAIFLTNVEAVPEQHADALKSYVENGGLLIIFVGDKVKSDKYNDILLPRKLMPGIITKRVDCGERPPFQFDYNVNTGGHPLLSVFKDEAKSGLTTASVWTYLHVELGAGSKVERVLDYRLPEGQPVDPKASGNDPAITRHALGKGRVVFFSTTASPEWTSLPAKKAFVALIQELVLGSFSSGDRWMNVNVGERLTVPQQVTGDKFALVDSAGQSLPMEAETVEDRQVYRSGVLNKPGLYKLSTGKETLPIAVNIPADEADIRVMETGALRAALGNAEIVMEGDTLASVDAFRRAQKDFGWAVMIALLLLLGLECYMAM